MQRVEDIEFFFRACEGNRCFDVFVRVESGGDRDDDERL
jgi:hypothetical protein